MTQWINVLWNNGFVNPMHLPLLCEKTGALAIVELGLTAGCVYFSDWTKRTGLD